MSNIHDPAQGPSDHDLMERAAEGDTAPFATLYERHAGRVRTLAYHILHSTIAADDIVQETFTRGLVHVRSYRGESAPAAWLMSIALNECRHALRRKKVQAELADTSTLELGDRPRRPRSRGVFTKVCRKEGDRLLTISMGYLTDAQREAFVLHYLDGLPYEEIGLIMGVRTGAARALAFRARSVLQEKIGARLDEILNK